MIYPLACQTQTEKEVPQDLLYVSDKQRSFRGSMEQVTPSWVVYKDPYVKDCASAIYSETTVSEYV